MSGHSLIRKICLALALVLATAGMFAAGPANAANIFEKGIWMEGPRYDAVVPSCEAALGQVADQFAEKERIYWNSSLQITGYSEVREIAVQPWTSANMPRRFCSAKAMLSDGKPRRVNFSVIEDGGYASMSSGVEFCVVGLDRNWAFNPACRAARP